MKIFFQAGYFENQVNNLSTCVSNIQGRSIPCPCGIYNLSHRNPLQKIIRSISPVITPR